ncbi:MAG: tetratricopeptide repeat protein, partial [Alphaproteobacteria bacterium]
MAKRRKQRNHAQKPAHSLGPVADNSRNQKVRTAADHLEAGRLDDAEAILEEINPAKARDAEALHLLGPVKVCKGRLQEGLSMIDRSILADPAKAWMRVNRGAVRQGQGDHPGAIEDLEEAVSLDPKSSVAWGNLAASRSVIGDYPGAAIAAKEAADLDPKNVSALIAYGNTLSRAENFATAADVYARALKIAPNQLNARVSLLQVLQKLDRDDDAAREIALIARAMGTRVAEAEASGEAQSHIDSALAKGIGEAVEADAIMAMALESLGLRDQALAAAERACQLAPESPHAWAARGIILFKLERAKDAIEPLERALELRPGWAEISGALGNVYWTDGRNQDAIEVLERAVEQAPNMASLWGTLAATRRELRDMEGSEAAYQRALELAPKSGGYAMSLALTQLRQKKFDVGLKNYERRWEAAGFADQVRPHKHPIWDGEDLRGRKVLVFAEQGVGDEVMVSGLLGRLTDMGAAVYLEANGRLVSLFERSFPGVIVGQSQNPPLPAFTSGDFDCQAPHGTLFGLLVPQYKDLRPSGPYLKADPKLASALREKYLAYGDGKELLVGIAWRSGNPVSGRRRSAELELWKPILAIPGVRFVNLQYGETEQEIAAIRDACGAQIIEDSDISTSGNLDGFAAQVAALDLVVSTDNSTVHFAGALGIPTCMLLNYEPDWRWFGAEEGNPWYESVAHIRQEAPEDWPPVIDAAADIIREMATTGMPPVAADPIRPAMVNRGAKPKALLLNDTTAWYHWGCTATSLAMRAQIEAKGYEISAAPIRAIYAARPAPPVLSDFDDDQFFQTFVDANPVLMRQVANADKIIVNGEGTLHGLSDNVRALLYATYAASARMGKSVQIINHSCYPEDAPTITDPIANGVYRKVYSTLEYAAFREHITHGLMAKIGVEGALAFDSLPLTVKHMRESLPQSRSKRLVIAGSASADESTAASFAEYARWAASQGWTVVMLGGARAFPAMDEATFMQALARHGMPAGTELI